MWVCSLSLLTKTLLFQLRWRHDNLPHPLAHRTACTGALYVLSTTIRSPTTANYNSCKNENSLFPHQHLNKAVEDLLCRKPRKLAKERRWTGFSVHPQCLMFSLISSEMKEEFSHFQIQIPLIFQRYNVNHSTCFPMISYHHNSLIYWKIISSTEGKPRITAL